MSKGENELGCRGRSLRGVHAGPCVLLVRGALPTEEPVRREKVYQVLRLTDCNPLRFRIVSHLIR